MGKHMKAILPPEIPYKVRKAIQKEINEQTAENVRQLALNLQAIVLWSVHQQLGFGKKRLLEFQKNFLPLIEELQEFYQAEDADETEFILLYKLKNEVGIDVKELGDMFKLQVRLRE